MYHHVQRSPMNVLLYLPALFAFVIAWQIRNDALPGIVVAVIGLILLLVAWSFQTLAVSEDHEHLNIRYGPLNLFGTRIAFRDITAVEKGKTSVIDGWRIHFIPFRGWTFNLWGFECVKISLDKKVIRVGTNDSENLARCLRERIERDTVTE